MDCKSDLRLHFNIRALKRHCCTKLPFRTSRKHLDRSGIFLRGRLCIQPHTNLCKYSCAILEAFGVAFGIRKTEANSKKWPMQHELLRGTAGGNDGVDKMRGSSSRLDKSLRSVSTASPSLNLPRTSRQIWRRSQQELGGPNSDPIQLYQ
ncbi:uncharacterized protein BDR25DRAFT_359803 [Lindgomyces ingoldianus]|uniref:Uncharacterized protein n=1 Tax=Lindgomyces ingoldianus TaxID=673940 RepID=A0ACB6QK14_9PLEO|nr:uncharacterized protein BDR25DRAFT_359803 [Lindgomyces ingoldianus]KAF2466475.1 hypothetical protein BDR25DRAFT_359803 [Lindgomyces ingoldianus]